MKGPTPPVVLGDTVLFHGTSSNGVYEHPALVTRVWSETMLNLQVLPDFGAPYVAGSVNYDPSPMLGSGIQSWRAKQPF